MSSLAYTQLKDFITNRMRMSHIYQPVMLQVMLEHGGRASREEIAKAILDHDRSHRRSTGTASSARSTARGTARPRLAPASCSPR